MRYLAFLTPYAMRVPTFALPLLGQRGCGTWHCHYLWPDKNADIVTPTDRVSVIATQLPPVELITVFYSKAQILHCFETLIEVAESPVGVHSKMAKRLDTVFEPS
jgi:hypothetical protein